MSVKQKSSFAPLPHEWMLVSIIGFFISIFTIYGWSKTWGFTFAVFFVIVFIASFVAMDSTSLREEEMIELAIHDKRVRSGAHRRHTNRWTS